jgi:hypothetical protein
MTKARTPHAGAGEGKPRKHRRRPIPKWLQGSEQLDAIARSRCLLVLSVLSGEKAVTDAIGEAKISRGTYYQFETRALQAMLAALNPLASTSETGSADLSAAAARIEALQGQVARLEQEKRRTQRLLLLTRKSIRAPVTTGHRGRLPRNVVPASSRSGRSRSATSKMKAMPQLPSIQTRTGEGAC